MVQVGSFQAPPGIYIDIYIYTWNPNDPCFAWSLGFVLRG